MGKFDQFAFSAQPSFDEAATRKAFSQAVPLKTLVIFCYDPRAAEILNAVAKLFDDEVYPGEHPTWLAPSVEGKELFIGRRL